MNREEILSASRKQNTGMDEKAHSDYRNAYMLGAAVSVCIASIFAVVESIIEGESFGYIAIIMAYLGTSGLVFGKKNSDTAMGKLYLVAGVTGLLAFLINFVLHLYYSFC